MLLDGYNLVEGIKKFVDFVEDYPIVFHNAKFDMGFLNIASNKLYGKDLENDCLDTLVLSRKLVSNVKDYKLGTLADYFNVVIYNAVVNAVYYTGYCKVVFICNGAIHTCRQR